MMAHFPEHRDIESHGLELIVQKQGTSLLNEERSKKGSVLVL